MTAVHLGSFQSFAQRWDRLFHTPRDTRVLDVMRIGYAVLMAINLLVLAPDLALFFGENGLASVDESRAMIDPDAVTLFQVLPRTGASVLVAYWLLLGHTVLFGLGWYPRVQALGILIWYTTFNHRFLWLWDGEDTLFRLLAFLFILCPLGYHWSLDRRRRMRRGQSLDDGPRSAWGLVLIRIQMTAIYLSTAWEKLDGSEWLDGTALYFVSRLDDVFARFPLIDAPFEHMWSIRLMTWTVLAIEVALPVALWIRNTRRAAVIAAVLLHLSIDYMMVLFLFQWLMIVGLLSFVEVSDIAWARKHLRRVFPEGASRPETGAPAEVAA